MKAAALAVAPVTQLFKGLGDDTRLRIVALLSHGELLCVCHVQSALELPQPLISRHLAVLRAAGIVQARRKGTWMYYQLAEQTDHDRERLLASLIATFAAKDVLKRDVEKLLKTRLPGMCK